MHSAESKAISVTMDHPHRDLALALDPISVIRIEDPPSDRATDNRDIRVILRMRIAPLKAPEFLDSGATTVRHQDCRTNTKPPRKPSRTNSQAQRRARETKPSHRDHRLHRLQS